MPMTVITLKKVPNSLRGDLTKWMQEIATGVYIGNFNSRIREKLWNRVLENVGNGEATLSYASQNEVGYLFTTFNSERRVLDVEGIPLVFLPAIDGKQESQDRKGFSQASKFHKARRFSTKGRSESHPPFVILDLETTGLDPKKDRIIEIGAILMKGSRKQATREYFHRLIKIQDDIPDQIKKLTGISRRELEEKGVSLQEALKDLVHFLGPFQIVGYGISFDLRFLNQALEKNGMNTISNKSLDLMRLVKKEKGLLENYKLQTVLPAYSIDRRVPHRALEDAIIIAELSEKVMGFKSSLKWDG